MQMTTMEDHVGFLRERREELLGRIAEAARRASRDADEVTLLAVSKTVGSRDVAAAHMAGYDVFGENRPQELRQKVHGLAVMAGFKDLRFDMIGNLQTNKINMVLELATLIHSVSSVHLAEAINRRATDHGMVARCLLEVNVSGEASKSGLAPQDVPQAMDAVMHMEGLALEGLMTMAPANDVRAAHLSFGGLRELRDDLRTRTGLSLPVLSCGMSDDFEIAVEEGSTLVRLGRIVFDPDYATTSD